MEIFELLIWFLVRKRKVNSVVVNWCHLAPNSRTTGSHRCQGWLLSVSPSSSGNYNQAPPAPNWNYLIIIFDIVFRGALYWAVTRRLRLIYWLFSNEWIWFWNNLAVGAEAGGRGGAGWGGRGKGKCGPPFRGIWLGGNKNRLPGQLEIVFSPSLPPNPPLPIHPPPRGRMFTQNIYLSIVNVGNVPRIR